MEKGLNAKFSLKDMFKTLGDLMWNSEDIIDEDEKLPKDLQMVSDRVTKKAENLTNIKSPKTKNKELSNIKTQNQLLNDKAIKSKKLNIEDREREE